QVPLILPFLPFLDAAAGPRLAVQLFQMPGLPARGCLMPFPIPAHSFRAAKRVALEFTIRILNFRIFSRYDPLPSKAAHYSPNSSIRGSPALAKRTCAAGVLFQAGNIWAL